MLRQKVEALKEQISKLLRMEKDFKTSLTDSKTQINLQKLKGFLLTALSKASNASATNKYELIQSIS